MRQEGTMKTYDVCLEVKTLRMYRIEARSEEDAVKRASERAERRPDVSEVVGGSAQEAETKTS